MAVIMLIWQGGMRRWVVIWGGLSASELSGMASVCVCGGGGGYKVWCLLHRLGWQWRQTEREKF